MLNSLRDRLSRGLQQVCNDGGMLCISDPLLQSPAPVAAYEDEDEHGSLPMNAQHEPSYMPTEPERRQANPKRVIHHIESSVCFTSISPCRLDRHIQIERVTQFGEFLVTNLRNKLEAADLDENAGRGEGGEAEAEQPKSVKVYGAGTLPAGLEDLRRSDLFAKGSVGESRRRDGEAGRKNSAAGAEEGWEDVSDQTSQGSAARSAGQDELEAAWKPTFHDMSLLGVGKEIRCCC